MRATCAVFTYYVMFREIAVLDWSIQVGHLFDLYWQTTIGCSVTWPVLINTVMCYLEETAQEGRAHVNLDKMLTVVIIIILSSYV